MFYICSNFFDAGRTGFGGNSTFLICSMHCNRHYTVKGLFTYESILNLVNCLLLLHGIWCRNRALYTHPHIVMESQWSLHGDFRETLRGVHANSKGMQFHIFPSFKLPCEVHGVCEESHPWTPWSLCGLSMDSQGTPHLI